MTECPRMWEDHPNIRKTLKSHYHFLITRNLNRTMVSDAHQKDFLQDDMLYQVVDQS